MNGENIPNAIIVRQIAVALACSADELLDLRRLEPRKPPVANSGTPLRIRRLR
jgi:hypothetical protein